MKKLVTVISAFAFLSACATQPEQIAATPIPASLYMNSSCAQLRQDEAQIVAAVNALTADQKQKATGDAVAMGIGLVLFWPALFVLAAGSDKQGELANAKGQYDAIQKAKAAKGC